MKMKYPLHTVYGFPASRKWEARNGTDGQTGRRKERWTGCNA